MYGGLETLPPVVSGVMYPRPTPRPPEARIPHLKFFSKVDRVEGTPVDIITEANRRHAIYLARTPLDPSDGDLTTVFVKFTAHYDGLLIACLPTTIRLLHPLYTSVDVSSVTCTWS